MDNLEKEESKKISEKENYPGILMLLLMYFFESDVNENKKK